MHQRTIALLALAMLLSSAGRAAPDAEPINNAREVVKGNNAFALDLYAQLGKQEGNVFFSPYSISTALAMTYAGAKGETAKQMAKTLHFELPQDALHAGFPEVIRRLNRKDEHRPYQLTTANMLWGQKGVSFFKDFVNLTESKYGAGLKELNFRQNPEEARQAINAWVEKETNQKIKDLLVRGDVTQTTRLVLTNAIYFNAPWETEFSKGLTKPAEFTLTGGEKVKVGMMHQYHLLDYLDGGHFQAVAIPYRHHALSLIVLLPKKDSSLATLEKSLSSANLAKWLSQMADHLVDLKLPQVQDDVQVRTKQDASRHGHAGRFHIEGGFRRDYIRGAVADLDSHS